MRIAITFALGLLVGCGPANDKTPVDDGDDDGGGADGGVIENPPIDAGGGACDQMDILFVIDNSESMSGEQANLIANFPGFVSVLDDFRNADGDPVDYHVGVTTTGVSKRLKIGPISDTIHGEDGHLQTGDGGCGMTRGWLERDDADVSTKFSCAANVGTDGSVDEMPLEAARLALGDRVTDGSNAGFLREDALLAIVMLTDEQDCSYIPYDINLGLFGVLCDDPPPTDVAPYLAAFDAAKGGERNRWATAVIAGIDPEPCSSDLGSAAPATRLVDFAGRVGENAVTSSICEGDLASALGEAMAKFQAACDAIDDVE
jgi:hypothetical protein